MAFSPTNIARWRDFAIAYASALHASGASTAAVEADLARVLGARQVEGTVMATPTALWIEVGDRARVLRVEPAEPKLDLQTELRALADEVARGALPPSAAVARILELRRDPGPYPPLVTGLAFVIASAGSAVLLGGTATDAAATALVSVATMAVSGRLGRTAGWSRLADGSAALVAGALAQLAAVSGASSPLVALASVIVLAPGLLMTTGAAETAAGHWSSGAARFAGVAAVLVQLAAGLALAQALVPALPARMEPLPLVSGAEPFVAALAVLALAVLVRVRRADLPWTVAIAAVTYVIADAIPSAVGALLGALAATVLANGLGRIRGSATGGLAIPSLLMLVPGSIGVRGVALLLDRAVVPGLETAVGAAMAASALAAGILLGHAILPETAPHPSRIAGAVDVPDPRRYRMAGRSESR